ncbi:hypothetical protein [Sphingobacterium rhinopitheci]|uniref:hypothetical protein n=1 Tax=Sphingobacterium rhinopitheci TaxID=2781960 RepID=UPI001F522EE2|nr:hypothetical protein [Sphingobacterium rhinopitheci]MCI0919818.1 hypothetical protein [Sphingobacterium rhinopitheci]
MDYEDDKLKKLMQDSRLEMPFSDFEDRMMSKIESYELNKAKAGRSQFFAVLCFLIGTVFGTVLNFIVSRNLDWISSSVAVQDVFYLASQLIYVILIILFSDKLWKLIKISKINTKGSF